jgi:hypothetical protein
VFTKIAASFSDSHKAEECLHKLNKIKDNNLFKSLEKLLEEPTFTKGQAIKVCYKSNYISQIVCCLYALLDISICFFLFSFVIIFSLIQVRELIVSSLFKSTMG